MRKSISILLAVICVGCTASVLTAQNIIINNNLAFGNIVCGIPRTISKRDAGAAAEYHVSGIAGDEVSVVFALPTYLSNGSSHMQIVFRNTDCAMDSSATPDQGAPGFDNQDPWHPITYRLGASGLTIWLGGMVIPGLTQKSGGYSQAVVLTVTYTNN
jgi:hypothetical protein